MRRLLLVAVVAALSLTLIGGLFSSPQRGIAQSLAQLKQAVANEDLATVEALLLSPAKERWWIVGLRAALARRDRMTEAERDLVNAMYAEYRKMVEGIQLVAVTGEGDRATATLRMTVPVGGYAFALEFPTTWQRRDDTWRLARTNWDSREWVTAHRKQSLHHPGPENHAGYPPFSLHRSPTPDPPASAPIPRTRFDCPRDMVAVPAGPGWMRFSGQRYAFSGESDHQIEVPDFCIDRYEASQPKPGATAPGGELTPASSRAEATPWVGVSWPRAKTACEAAGKRLCTGIEWQKAAGGPDGLLYPNGNTFDPNACNTYDPATGPRKLAPTGAFPKCRSPYGAYDMCGNVSEWTDELWQEGMDDRVVRGGSFNENPINGQGIFPFFGWRFTGYGEDVAAIHHHPPGVMHEDDGFRCCLTPEP